MAGSGSDAREPTSEIADDGVDSLRVLVMDDEWSILKMLQRTLKRLGHTCVVTFEGYATVEIHRGGFVKGAAFDVVILDLTVPGGLGGCEALAQIIAIDSKAVCIASSGCSDNRVLSSFASHGFSGMLTKPYGVETLKKGRAAEATSTSPD